MGLFVWFVFFFFLVDFDFVYVTVVGFFVMDR